MNFPKPSRAANGLLGVLVFVIAAGLAPGTPRAAEAPNLPPAPYKPLPKGTVVEYRDIKYEVQSVNGMDTVFKVGTRQLFRARTFGITHAYAVFGRSGELAYSSSPDWSADLEDGAKKALEGLWPLKVGNKASFQVEEKKIVGSSKWRNWTVSIEVLATGFTRISTQPGLSFPVYIVEEKGHTPATVDSKELQYIVEYRYNPDSALVLNYIRSWQSQERTGESELWYRDYFTGQAGEGSENLRLVAWKPQAETPAKNQAAGQGDLEAENARLKKEVERLKRELARALKGR